MVSFIINITMEINFSSKVTPKVYSKDHLCCVPHLRKLYLLRSMDTDT